ncbi:TerB family tellurite resistance protein [Urechidicola vernalis]|uniref:TerB family tellurite resistance protein n=1 Tax=Urechidicola vernalis TaxID=3075600 RepID=A0ABU2Y7U4_9FLAO|nr:TerB family tellurite resistance protein [Urechidicola sp. P050]MDT0554268.1 TerB family tellurite resistance protein [Urechidicola sp. P050]
MGNFTKWFGATLGWSFGGPIGGIIGFVVGSFIDGFSKEDVENAKRFSQTSSSTQSGDFEMSLLILSAVVIKADGKVDKRELKYVRDHFIQMYGRERADHAFKLFNGIIKNNNISTRQVCMQIRQHMTHATRLQLVHFLFGIAKADGHVNESEVEMIHKIANYLYINHHDFESIKAMFYSGVSNAYKVLEIEKSATDQEVKKAYRKLVKKHHPDKLQHLGEEHLKGAQEKFQQIQKAYETIQNERGI